MHIQNARSIQKSPNYKSMLLIEDIRDLSVLEYSVIVNDLIQSFYLCITSRVMSIPVISVSVYVMIRFSEFPRSIKHGGV